MSLLVKIADIESEMARTQKNKATAHHLGLLKAKLAKLRRELITPKGGSGGGTGEGWYCTIITYRCYKISPLELQSSSCYYDEVLSD